MPTIDHRDRLRPSLLPHRGPLRLLPAPLTGTGPLERFCTLPLAALALLALWIHCLVPRSIEDPDIWWHLRNAAVEWHTHGWLHHDLYSFTAAGAPWINHEWLSEVPFYLGWRLAGTRGLYAVTLLTIEFILLGVYQLTRALSRGASGSGSPVSIALATTGVAAVLATVSFGPRMLLFGWACLVLELLALERFYRACAAGSPQGDRAIFALPLLFGLWINLHGSWLIGLVLLVTFILASSCALDTGSLRSLAWKSPAWKRLGIVLLLSIGALFLNPYGWRLVLYPFDMAFHQPLNIASAEEWKPLDFQTARGLIFLLSLAALFLVQLTRRMQWALWELAFAAIGIYAACRHSRFLFLGAILVMPLLGKQLAHCYAGRAQPRRIYRFDSGRARNRPWLNAAVLTATLLLFGCTSFRRSPAPLPARFPASALPYLRQLHPQGRLFNEYLWGGYLAYNVPRLPVFIDSRMDIFERNGTLRDYLDIIYLNRSLALLDKYQVRYVFFEKDTPLVYLLRQTHAWQPAYEDASFILLERLPGSSVDQGGRAAAPALHP